MRMFIGIKLSNDNLEKIKTIQDNLDVDGRWTSVDNIHLTLVFLGELNNTEVSKVKAIVRSINYHKFSFTGEELAMIRDIVVINITNNEDLQGLYNILVKKLQINGFAIDNRNYHPHITLVRKSSKKTRQSFNITENVDRIVLFSSEYINNKLTYVIREQGTLK